MLLCKEDKHSSTQILTCLEKSVSFNVFVEVEQYFTFPKFNQIFIPLYYHNECHDHSHEGEVKPFYYFPG